MIFEWCLVVGGILFIGGVGYGIASIKSDNNPAISAEPKIHDNEYYNEEPVRAFRVNAGNHLITNLKISGIFSDDFDIVAIRDLWVELYENKIVYYPLYTCSNSEEWLREFWNLEQLPESYVMLSYVMMIKNGPLNKNITLSDATIVKDETKAIEKRYCYGFSSTEITEENYYKANQ